MSITKTYLELLDEHITGWLGLLMPILSEIDKYNNENPDEKIEIQVKEKYGGLRLELSGGFPYLEQLTFRAEKESHKVCQLCGIRGKTRWIKDWCWTLCKHHAKARKKANHDEEKTRLLFMKYLR